MTFDELKQKLSAIEPGEEMYQGISEADLPHLERLAAEPKAWLAARAIFAASRLRSVSGDRLLLRASEDNRSEVRVAAVTAAAQVGRPVADPILAKSLADTNPGVVKFAIRGVAENSSAEVRRKLTDLAEQRSPVVSNLLVESARLRLRTLRER